MHPYKIYMRYNDYSHKIMVGYRIKANSSHVGPEPTGARPPCVWGGLSIGF